MRKAVTLLLLVVCAFVFTFGGHPVIVLGQGEKEKQEGKKVEEKKPEPPKQEEKKPEHPKQEEKKPEPAPDKKKEPPPQVVEKQDGKAGRETTAFFDIPVTKQNIFVIDKSGSMKLPASEPKADDISTPGGGNPKGLRSDGPDKMVRGDIAKKILELKEQNEKREVKTRIDALKKEFINTLYYLPKDSAFTIIFFSNKVHVEMENMKATWDNKLKAIEAVEALTPDGGTNLFGALEKALELAKGERKNSLEKDNGSGTSGEGPVAIKGEAIYLLTDGSPTIGPFVEKAGNDAPFDKDKALDWVKKEFEKKKVRIHAIALGDPPEPGKPRGEGVDIDLLKKIAELTQGVFKHVINKK